MIARLTLPGRVAASLGVCSAVLHLLALPGMEWMAAAAMATAATVCLACTPSLWRGGNVRTWAMAANVSLAMVVLHGVLMLRSRDHASTREHLAAHARGEGWDLMHIASVVGGVELLIAAVALVALRMRDAGRSDRWSVRAVGLPLTN